MSRFNALLLFLAIGTVLPAFPADPPQRTPDFGPAAPPPQPADEIDPATGLARSTTVRPLTGVPPVPGARRVAPQGVRPHIALILPTASPAMGKLADAVRQGFVAAAEAAGREAMPVNITAVENEGAALLDACRGAHSEGAVLVVAAITRDGASALARSDCPRQPVLALNDPQAAGEPPANLYSVSLAIENEARQVALLAVSEGWRSAVVITSPTPLARRVQEAFEREWIRAAGQVSARLTFSGTAEDAPLVRERLASVRTVDMVFMALDQPEARAVRGYITGMLPLYATSLSVNPRAEAIVNVDLQGVRYMEMPWFVIPDHPAVMVYPVPRGVSVEQERLYALGIDAYRLALQLLRQDRRPLDGVTGRIALESGSSFSRTLTPAEVDGGRVIPLRSP